MGQQVVALMWGISSKAKGLIVDGDYFWEASEDSKKRYVGKDEPSLAYEGGVCGYAVASGPGRDDDEGYLGTTTTLEAIHKTHATHIRRAQKKWDKFADWALKEHGKRLPKSALWITTDERA